MSAGTAAPTARPVWGIVWLLASMVMLSVLDGTSKWVMAAGVPLLFLAWIRYAVHLVLVLALVVPARGWSIVRTRQPGRQFVRGAFMFCATLSFFTTLRLLPQSEATAINFLAPLIVLAVSPWVLGEQPRMSRWVAAGVGFAGVLLIIRPGSGLPLAGVAAGLVTACLFAGQFVATRRIAGENPFTSLIWSGGVGTACLTLALPVLWSDAMAAIAQLSAGQILIMLSTGFSGALGHLFQIGAYRNAPASTLAPVLYLQIVTSTAMGWLVWRHFPDATTWLGIAVVCASGITISLLEWRRGQRLRQPIRAVSR